MKEEINNGNDLSIEKTLLGGFLELLAEGKVDGGETRVMCAAMNIIFAATSTSAAVFYAFINVLTHYPDVVSKLQASIFQKFILLSY